MVVCHVLLPFLLALSADCPAQRFVIDSLVQRLGSRSYHEREAASAALEAVGEAALPALRHAQSRSDDAEIRRRAGSLVQMFEECMEEKQFQATRKQVEAITNSSISGEQKGCRLIRVIRPGMSMYRVRQMLGNGEEAVVWGGGTIAVYRGYRLAIMYHGEVVQEATRVDGSW
jgi:hypothetical protein